MLKRRGDAARMVSKRKMLFAAWLAVIAAFAGLHAVHLAADFPNHSPWWMDWAKYTDEGWYGNAAIRGHLTGSWYLRGDFNPGPAVPVWPFLEWLLFCATGVSLEAARGLAVGFFFGNLWLTYLLVKYRSPRWVALLAVTLLVTSPFLYGFSRLAILEPMLICFTLAALNVAVRLGEMRRPVLGAAAVGLLFTLMMLSKTTAVFLLPALGWAMGASLRDRHWAKPATDRRHSRAEAHMRAGDFVSRLTSGPDTELNSLQDAADFRAAGASRTLPANEGRTLLAAAGAFVASFGVWMALVAHAGLMADYRYLFTVNKYPKPTAAYWPLVSFWWSFHGGLWVDHILIPLAGVLVAAAFVASHRAWARGLLLDPGFGACVLAVMGYILFMTYQDHPQPRYFTVVAWFSLVLAAQGIGALIEWQPEGEVGGVRLTALPGWAALGVAMIAVGTNAETILDYVLHPEYTFVQAARGLTRYIDEHPNGNRLLLAVSGDEIELVTHLPTINDLFTGADPSIPDLATKLAVYRPGWYACWNVMDQGAIEDLHSMGWVEQVASFHAYDDPTRDVLVLFKLHPWPDGRVRDPGDEDLHVRLPEDRFEIPLQ
jgi:hypothetical protein